MSAEHLGYLSDAELTELIENCFDSAKGVMRDSPEDQLVPMLTVLSVEPEGERTLMVFVLMDFDERKYDLLQRIGTQVGQWGHIVPAVVLVSEAWMVVYEEPDMQLFRAEGGFPMPPSEDSRHRDVLISAGMTVDQRVQMVAMELYREDGQVSLEPIHEAQEPLTGCNSDLLRSFYKGYTVAFLDKWMSQFAG